MRQTLSILFLLLYITAYTEVHQLLKLPVLFTHFTEHKGSEANLTFLDFVSMHYFTDTVDGDYARDQQLPFKGNDCLNNPAPIAMLPYLFSNNLTISFRLLSTKTLFEVSQRTTDFHISVWQPPKA